MDRVESDKVANYQVKVWKEFDEILELANGKPVKVQYVERFQFYEQAKKSYAIIQTGYIFTTQTTTVSFLQFISSLISFEWFTRS